MTREFGKLEFEIQLSIDQAYERCKFRDLH